MKRSSSLTPRALLLSHALSLHLLAHTCTFIPPYTISPYKTHFLSPEAFMTPPEQQCFGAEGKYPRKGREGFGAYLADSGPGAAPSAGAWLPGAGFHQPGSFRGRSSFLHEGSWRRKGAADCLPQSRQ